MSSATLIEIEFLSGRYHAHVWGEAQFGMSGPEWPPSPWRLLRALAAAWFSSSPPRSSERDRDALLEKLGRSAPPEFWLPRASFHEIRYYQPIRLGASDRVQHHDHYAVPEGSRFWFHFNVGLTERERQLLEELLKRLRYFGRAESRARLRLAEAAEPAPGVKRVVPRGGPGAPSDSAYRFVLCTAPDFRAADLWSVRDGRSRRSGDGHPCHLTDLLLKKRMPLPCGTRWVEYAIPTDLVVYEIPPRKKTSKTGLTELPVAEIHFRLNRRIPIPVQLLVAVARAFRDAAVRNHGYFTGVESTTLSGRNPDGSVARGHQHAYYLPQLAADRPYIDKLIVRIPSGRLTRPELDALLGVEHLCLSGHSYPITVVPERTVSEPIPSALAIVWRNSTPFIPPLGRRRGRSQTCVEQQAAASVEQLFGVRPARVEITPGPGRLGRVVSVFSHRYDQGASGSGRHWTLTRRLGMWLKFVFDEPVVLDSPFGADAHFGAGQIEPKAEQW